MKFTDQMQQYFNQNFESMAQGKQFCTFEDYKAVKEADPEFLSIIEDIGDMSLSNTLINEKKGDETISHAELAQYHESVLQMFEETRDEIRKAFDIE